MSSPTVAAAIPEAAKDGLISNLIDYIGKIDSPPRFRNIYEAVQYFELQRGNAGMLPPVLNSLQPSTAVLGTPSFTLRVLGDNFDPASQIIWNGSAEPTTFVSKSELTTGVNMDTAIHAVPIPITVTSGFGVVSNELIFNFLPAVEPEVEAEEIITTEKDPARPPTPYIPTKK